MLEEDLITQMTEISFYCLTVIRDLVLFGVNNFIIRVTREWCTVAVDDCPICRCTVVECIVQQLGQPGMRCIL